MASLNYGPKAERFALRPLERDWRLNILQGSVRSGKTWCLHPKILYGCQYPVAGQKIITGVSKQAIYNNVLSDLFNLIGPSNYSFNRQSGELLLFGVPWLVMGAKDEGSEKYVRGMTVGLAVGDELTLMPQSFFHMLLSRMSPEGARFYGTTNPDNPHHWLHVDYLLNDELRDDKILWSEHFTMEDNPNLSRDYIEAQKKLYTGVFYKRFILGLWVAAEGAIYGDVLTDATYFDDRDMPVGLKGAGGYAARYIGVDYGTANPCVFLDVYDDGQTLWQTNEYYWDSRKEMKQKTDAEYGADFEKFVGADRRGLTVVVDPSAASFKLELIRRGFRVKDAHNDVIEGIRHTSALIGARRYRIHKKNCPKTVAEATAYAWDQKKARRGVEEPIKADDHTCDAKRYICKTMVPSWRLAA